MMNKLFMFMTLAAAVHVPKRSLCPFLRIHYWATRGSIDDAEMLKGERVLRFVTF